MNPKCFVPSHKLFLHEQFTNFLNKRTNTIINIEISLCGMCNANCPFCFYGENKDKDILNVEELLNFLAECKKHEAKAITWTGGGEPTLHPKFAEITKEVDKLGFYQGLFTNALAPIKYNLSLFEWIRVSKTDKKWPIKNICTIAENTKRVGLCYNWDDQDKSKIKEIEFALDLIDNVSNIEYLQVRPALPLNGETKYISEPYLSEKHKYHEKLFMTDYKFKDCQRKKDYEKCYGYHFVPFLWHNGDFGSCGYQRENIFGNIYTEDHAALIEHLPSEILVREDCMVCCKNNMINKSINEILKIEDVNFV